MCGCSSGSSIKYGKSSFCGSKVNSLTEARNKMATLQNITTDPIKKEQYKETKEYIDDILKQSAATGTCPEQSVVTTIVDEVNYEYSEYYNT